MPRPELQFAKHLEPWALGQRSWQTKPRKWAVDWAFVSERGSRWKPRGDTPSEVRHAHARTGSIRDQEKFDKRALALLGWRLLRAWHRRVDIQAVRRSRC